MNEQNPNSQSSASELAKLQIPPVSQNPTPILIPKPPSESKGSKFYFLWTAIVILLFFVGFFGTYFAFDQYQAFAPVPTPTPILIKPCTQEAKLCPDAITYVGRTGPSCEFSACPATPSASAQTADWDTFTSDVDGFSIKYPPYLFPNICGGNLFNTEPLNDCVSQKPSLVAIQKEDRSVVAYINEWDNFYNVAETSVVVDSKTYQQFNFSKKENAPFGPTQVDSVVVTLIPNKDSNYIISYTQDAAPSQDLTKEYNLMLSTFTIL